MDLRSGVNVSSTPGFEFSLDVYFDDGDAWKLDGSVSDIVVYAGSMRQSKSDNVKRCDGSLF